MSFQVPLRSVLLKPWVVYGFKIHAMIQRCIQVFLCFFFGNAVVYPLLTFTACRWFFKYNFISIYRDNFIVQRIRHFFNFFINFKLYNKSITFFFYKSLFRRFFPMLKFIIINHYHIVFLK